jgi:hypothetical protein
MSLLTTRGLARNRSDATRPQSRPCPEADSILSDVKIIWSFKVLVRRASYVGAFFGEVVTDCFFFFKSDWLVLGQWPPPGTGSTWKIFPREFNIRPWSDWPSPQGGGCSDWLVSFFRVTSEGKVTHPLHRGLVSQGIDNWYIDKRNYVFSLSFSIHTTTYEPLAFLFLNVTHIKVRTKSKH